MTPQIALSVPQLNGREAEYLLECVQTNFVSSVGPFVGKFEKALAQQVGVDGMVACSSGTAALHLALLALDVGPGDVVAVSSLTFVAAANAVAYTGAKPLFVDSERRTWNLDTQRLHEEICARAAKGVQLPKAVVAVHILGHPVEIEPLLDLRERFGVMLVEDAAEALGATYVSGIGQGRHVGTLGDAGCYSFNGNKIVTCGGGGAVTMPDAERLSRARHLSTQARLPGRGYEHDSVGYNYRLTNLAAAVGLAQLEQLDDFVAAKHRIAKHYDSALAELPVTLPPRANWAWPSFWLYSVLLSEEAPPREVVNERLVEAGVEARPLWLPMHRQPPYQAFPVLGGGVAEDLHARGLSLPCSVGLSAEEQGGVVEAFRLAIRR